MRRISPEFIEQVRLANDIVDIIGEDTFLKRVGSRYMGLCPFPSHNEKTPSFSVSPDLQVYHCFGCGQSGNLFTYLQVRRGWHFMEAVKFLAQKAGLSLPDTQREDDKKYVDRKKLLEINQLACDFYSENLQALPASHSVRKFLRERDLSDETVKKFQLGYAPANWDGLCSHLRKKDGSLKLSEKLGLIKKKPGRYYDLFRDRLIFPVFAKNGRDILGFGGRILSLAGQPKYINSADSSVFHKGHTFYGWQHTAGFIRDCGKALVVEGYTDYLSLYQRGVRNVVATLGTALTDNHARWLSQYTQQVILSFDGDEAGEKAAERSLKVLLSYGVIPKVLYLEEGMDPDSFIRAQGKKALEEKTDLAQDLFLHLFLKELKKYPAGVDRFALIEKIADLLAQTKKETLREYYTSRFLDSFGFDEKVARQALQKALTKQELKTKRSFDSRKNYVSFRNSPQAEVEASAPAGRAAEEKKPLEGQESESKKFSLASAPKSELYLLILALESLDCYAAIRDSGVIKSLNHQGIIEMFKVISVYNVKKEEHFTALTQILSAYLYDPRELQKNKYPSLTYLSREKVKIFIQDCINKVEEEKKHLKLKNITAQMRSDGENTRKYLMKIAEWTKKSQSTGKEI